MIQSLRNAAIPNLRGVRRFATEVVQSPTEKKTIYPLPTPPGRGGDWCDQSFGSGRSRRAFSDGTCQVRLAITPWVEKKLQDKIRMLRRDACEAERGRSKDYSLALAVLASASIFCRASLALSLNNLLSIFPLGFFGITSMNSTPPANCLYGAFASATY